MKLFNHARAMLNFKQINMFSYIKTESNTKGNVVHHTCMHAYTEKLVLEIFNGKWKEFQEQKSNNLQFMFHSVYCNMVRRLLEFIETSRTRNWLKHLGWHSDMKQLEKSNRDIWNYFEEGNFSVQLGEIPGVAIGCDHAGEQ